MSNWVRAKWFNNGHRKPAINHLEPEFKITTKNEIATAFIIQELPARSAHMRSGIVLHHEEHKAHCTRSKNSSEHFIPVYNYFKEFAVLKYNLEVFVSTW